MDDGVISRRTLIFILDVLTEEQLDQILKQMDKTDPERILLSALWNRISNKSEDEIIVHLFEGELNDAIQDYIKQSGIKPSEVYSEMGISRQQWHSHTKKGQSVRFHDSRNILKIAVILHLQAWDTIYLLHLNGFSYPREADGYCRIVIRHMEDSSYEKQTLEELKIIIDEELLAAKLDTIFTEL